MNKPLLVLDTNVVLDLLHFDDPATRPLLQALQSGQVRCGVTDATFGEWQRVLAYPEFALDAGRQAVLAAQYRELSGWVMAGEPVTGLPRCSDPDDQKFIELAAASGAQVLVSKDHAVLTLRRRCVPLFQVMTPIEVPGWLDAALN